MKRLTLEKGRAGSVHVHNSLYLLAVLTLLTASGLLACNASAPSNPPLGPSDVAQGVVIGTPFKGNALSHWVNDLGELPPGAVSHVDVLYFHRTQRCESCLNAENYTRETLETHFADRLKNGWMSLRVLDMEKKENAALVQKFDVGGSALYLSIWIQGTEYLCPNQDIWFFTSNKYLFVDTLKKKIASLAGRG